MSSAYISLGTFLLKAHADKIRELLAREGLNATVRPAGDPLPGSPAWLKPSGQIGFVILVQDVDRQIAEEVFHRVKAEAFPPAASCDLCRTRSAQYTMYEISGGKRTVRRLCGECYDKGARS